MNKTPDARLKTSQCVNELWGDWEMRFYFKLAVACNSFAGVRQT